MILWGTSCVSSLHTKQLSYIRQLMETNIGQLEALTMTREEAIAIANKYNLQAEVIWCMDNGYTPEEALEEWDL